MFCFVFCGPLIRKTTAQVEKQLITTHMHFCLVRPLVVVLIIISAKEKVGQSSIKNPVLSLRL